MYLVSVITWSHFSNKTAYGEHKLKYLQQNGKLWWLAKKLLAKNSKRGQMMKFMSYFAAYLHILEWHTYICISVLYIVRTVGCQRPRRQSSGHLSSPIFWVFRIWQLCSDLANLTVTRLWTAARDSWVKSSDENTIRNQSGSQYRLSYTLLFLQAS